MTTVWFVTGTDTEVGKTVATAALAVALRRAGRDPYVVKPAQTGVTADEPGDLAEVQRLTGGVPGHEGVRLLAPLAPDAAARLEGASLPTVAAQAAAVVDAASRHHVLVEGAGGLLVNLGDDWGLLDLADAVQASGAAVSWVVVARSGLGTLNHSALTVDAIRARGHQVEGLVVGSWPVEPDLASEQNLLDLPRMTGSRIMARIPAGAGTWDAEEFAAVVAPGVELD
ncbi:dethiobiotin synthetase [Marmoricola sp. OAE513]|uniref:dethiobiotin synthase n=1 Tax=Marmoricola sp. OAE513 TaxID=2817894 RepID=UPI001AE716B0